MIGQSLLLATLKLMLCLVVVCSEQISEVMHSIPSSESTNSCNCPGDILTFECTVARGHGTIWSGTAFNCASSENEIYLINNQSNITCNSGKITGHIHGENPEGFYTSQLSVIISSDLIGKTVQCASVNPQSGTATVVENSTATIDILPYQSPEKVSISAVNFGLKEITFTWSPVAPDCPAVHYNILALNCGSCPTTTNDTNVTCTDVQDEGMCTFSVQAVVCGNTTGNVSERLTFNITETLNEMTTSNKVNTNSISILLAWSPIDSDCPAINYNILTSNCGSCPTTTDHTNITCVGVPTNGSTCKFEIKNIVCGDNAGNINDEAGGTFKAKPGCTGATASASIFAIILTISVIVFTSIIIVLVKANKRAHSIELTMQRRVRFEEDPQLQPMRTTITESTTVTNTTIYNDMDYEIAKVAVLATDKNIAYDDCHDLASGQTESETAEHMYARIH